MLQVEHQSLLDVIASMKLEWAQRKAFEALAVASAAAGRDASTPGAALALEAPSHRRRRELNRAAILGQARSPQLPGQ